MEREVGRALAKDPGDADAWLSRIYIAGCRCLGAGTLRASVNRAGLAQALAIESLSDAAGAAVAVRFRGGEAEIAVGERMARWRVASPAVRFHFQYPFVTEPGMWRWILGFDSATVLLDIGASVGHYSIAAADSTRTVHGASVDALIAGMARTLSDPRLRQVRLELRWWDAARRPLVARICRHGFRAAVDDDFKNLMFTRAGGAVGAEIVLPPARFRRMFR